MSSPATTTVATLGQGRKFTLGYGRHTGRCRPGRNRHRQLDGTRMVRPENPEISTAAKPEYGMNPSPALNSVDPMPSEMKISGGRTEDRRSSPCSLPASSTRRKAVWISARPGLTKSLTKLTAGELIITDDLNRNFRLAEKNRMELIKDNEATTAWAPFQHDGILLRGLRNFSQYDREFQAEGNPRKSKSSLHLQSGNKA